jgi:hypothetical protein
MKYDKRHVLDELVLSARKAVSAGHKVIIRETHEENKRDGSLYLSP